MTQGIRFHHPMLDQAQLVRSTPGVYRLTLVRHNAGRLWEHEAMIRAKTPTDARNDARREIRQFVGVLRRSGLLPMARQNRR